MIAHHQGAIEMANSLLEVGQDTEVKKLVEATPAASSQQAEIAEMEKLLRR